MKKILMKKKDVIEHYGSIAAVCKSLGIKPQAITQWGTYVPESSAWPLYYKSKRKIPAEINL